MWFRVRVVVVCLMAGLAAGCAPGIEIGSARNVVAEGPEFSTSLYHGYLDLAEYEYSEADYRDSDYFSRQAIKAASGNAPEPRDVRGRDLPSDYQGEAIASRARLMRVFEKGGRTRWPTEAARAQVMFDCWMQEQEEDHQPSHINQCREAFMLSIAKLEAATEPRRQMADAGPGDQVAMRDGALGAGSATAAAHFIVYFAFDRSEISPTAKRVIRDAVAQAQKLGAKRIDLTGHADRAGEVPYNQNLSLDRARAVASAMRTAGIDDSVVGLTALGENMPAFPTADGVRDHRNRRVVIQIAE